MDGSFEKISWLESQRAFNPLELSLFFLSVFYDVVSEHLQHYHPGKPQQQLSSTWDLAPFTVTSVGNCCVKHKCPVCENRSSSIKVILVLSCFFFWIFNKSF